MAGMKKKFKLTVLICSENFYYAQSGVNEAICGPKFTFFKFSSNQFIKFTWNSDQWKALKNEKENSYAQNE